MRFESGPLPVVLARVVVGVCTAVLALVVSVGCQPAASDCHPGATRCVGDELQSCVAHSGGLYGGGIGDTHAVKSSSPTWTHQATCERDLCVAASTQAFCVLSSTPNRACLATSSSSADSSERSSCDGTTEITCAGGFVVASKLCKVCGTSAVDCPGAYGASCASDAQCATGLSCNSFKECGMACSCPEGAPCPACKVIEDDADWLQTSAPLSWVCRAGSCLLK